MTLAEQCRAHVAPVACLVMGHRWIPWRDSQDFYLLTNETRLCSRCGTREFRAVPPKHINCRCHAPRGIE